MALPFFGAAVGAAGATLVDYALGRPLNLWGKQIEVSQTPAVRSGAYTANFIRPNILPPPDAIVEAMRRGFINRTMGVHALANQGVLWFPEGRAFGNIPGLAAQMDGGTRTAYAMLWEQVGKMRRSRPGPETVARQWQQGRLTEQQWDTLSAGLDWDSSLYSTAVSADYHVPGLADLLQLRRLGKINENEYQQGALALGWYNFTWRDIQERVTPLPSTSVLMRDRFLGRIDNIQYSQYMQALGHTDPATRARVESSYYQLPSGPELVNLAVRDAWNSDVVNRWGYDDEFPEPLWYFMRAQGWDWGVGFRGRDNQRYPSVKWPQLFWRAHWQVLPPGLAYQMYRRLRPERLDRYRPQFPAITPFTLDDLRTVLKVHDYPPKAREWLAAINSQPLRMYTIRTAYRMRVETRDWAFQQLKDGGYVDADAESILKIIDNEDDYKDQQAIKSQARVLNRQAAHEVIAGFRDGLVPRETAAQRLSNLGWGATMASQALNLAESQELRQTARAVLRALRRDYLTGVMSLPELTDRLVMLPLSQVATARYLQRWTAERSLQRRALSSSQVLALTAAGAIDAPAALARLANLGWVDPDASLLTGQATAKALRAAAHAQELLARKEQAQRRALEAAARKAAAAAKAAQAELRRITPLSVLRVWFQRGYRKAQWIRQRLLAEGLDTASIDVYLTQWADESYDKLLGATQGAADIAKILRKQTPLSTIKRLWQTGVVTDSWARRRLNDSGYTPESINLYVASWRQSLTPKQSGPAPEGSPIPATGP